MQAAVKEPVAYEHVFYSSRARNHIKDTNKYEFEFPGEWRTKHGKPCVFGIRALYLVKSTRVLSFMFCLTYKVVEQFTLEYYIEFHADEDQSHILAWLNGDLKAALSKSTDIPILKRQLQWIWDRTNDRIILRIPHDDWTDMAVVWSQRERDKDPFFEFEFLGPIGPAIYFWNRGQLLVQADFIHQTDNQHLGYTGCEYAILKKYEVQRNTPYFTLTFWDAATMRPVELPEDGMDQVVMEVIIQNELEVLGSK
jgi:hypothetical protein